MTAITHIGLDGQVVTRGPSAWIDHFSSAGPLGTAEERFADRACDEAWARSEGKFDLANSLRETSHALLVGNVTEEELQRGDTVGRMFSGLSERFGPVPYAKTMPQQTVPRALSSTDSTAWRADNYDWVPEASKEWDEYTLFSFLRSCFDEIARSGNPKSRAQELSFAMEALDFEIRMRGAVCRRCKTNCVKCCGPSDDRFPHTPRLTAYLNLEKSMLELDASGDEALADKLRDSMDPLWVALSDEEHSYLNSRRMTDRTSRPVATPTEEWCDFMFVFDWALTDREIQVAEKVSDAAGEKIKELRVRIARNDAYANRLQPVQRAIQEYLQRHDLGLCGENIYEVLLADAVRMREKTENPIQEQPMTQDFKIGDLVTLQSWGPSMTVHGIEDPPCSEGDITCVWFEEGKFQIRVFWRAELKPVPRLDKPIPGVGAFTGDTRESQ